MGFAILFGAAAWVGVVVYAIGMTRINRQIERDINRERERQGLKPYDWEEQ